MSLSTYQKKRDKFFSSEMQVAFCFNSGYGYADPGYLDKK